MSDGSNRPSTEKAREFLKTARAMGSSSKQKEQPIRDVFTSYLPSIFPDRPYWVRRHIDTYESSIISRRGGKSIPIFVDNLVDSTAIEYEIDLRQKTLFKTGYGQVQKYCAGLINVGVDPDFVTGVLSDTLEWHAYSVAISKEAIPGQVEPNQIILAEEEVLNLHDELDKEGTLLVNFLTKYLGREAARALSAENIARDLGLESAFYSNRISRLNEIVQQAFEASPEYSKIVTTLWENLVAYLDPDEKEFNLATYVSEFYITTLAKMICANALVGKPLNSSTEEIKSILTGDYFSNYQIDNMVEHDYFGWLLNEPYLSEISTIASEMQSDLLAYSFADIPGNRDLFGPLMAQLADQTRRILLGQEWTPYWLPGKKLDRLFHQFPEGERPRFVDPCCGSGTFISAVMASAKTYVLNEWEGEKDDFIDLLLQVVVGFDIDPVAVLLSRITWLLSIKEFIPDISRPFSIPVYHADSLFLVTPLEGKPQVKSGALIKLDLDGEKIDLPEVLLSAEYMTTFDDLVEQAYSIAVKASELAKQAGSTNTNLDLNNLKDHFVKTKGLESMSEAYRNKVSEFAALLSMRLATLDVQGRNGIWAFVIRNSYRPILMAGNFNGVISNPPWLAMSKLGNNPFKQATENLAIKYGIKPRGSAFPHLDLSTLFVMHAVSRFLSDNGAFAFIVPLTVLNGNQHNPFREITAPRHANSSRLTEIWEVGKVTFKNRAAVIFGQRSKAQVDTNTLPGLVVSKTEQSSQDWHWSKLGNRAIWSNQKPDQSTCGIFNYYNFHEGADILPGRLFFVDEIGRSGKTTRVRSIDRRSQLEFAVKDSKPPYDKFSLKGNCQIANEFIFTTLLSKHLSPYFIASKLGVPTVAPIKKEVDVWRSLNSSELVLMDRATRTIFDQIINELRSKKGESGRHDIWNDMLNFRNKLANQVLPRDC